MIVRDEVVGMVATLLAVRGDGMPRQTDPQHARRKLHIARCLGIEEGYDLALGIVIIEHDAVVRVVQHLAHHGMLDRDAPLVPIRFLPQKRTLNADSAIDKPVITSSMLID